MTFRERRYPDATVFEMVVMPEQHTALVLFCADNLGGEFQWTTSEPAADGYIRARVIVRLAGDAETLRQHLGG